MPDKQFDRLAPGEMKWAAIGVRFLCPSQSVGTEIDVHFNRSSVVAFLHRRDDPKQSAE
jgi:hypothetical protein